MFFPTSEKDRLLESDSLRSYTFHKFILRTFLTMRNFFFVFLYYHHRHTVFGFRIFSSNITRNINTQTFHITCNCNSDKNFVKIKSKKKKNNLEELSIGKN